jgi:MFS family permease
VRFIDGFTTAAVSRLAGPRYFVAALLLGTPFFIVFGALSDRIGRKRIILTGCVLAALTYFPLFHALTAAGNPALARALSSAPVQLLADPAECSFQFNPTGTAKFTSSCDIAKQLLANASVNYQSIGAAGAAQIRVGDQTLRYDDSSGLAAALQAAGYPKAAAPSDIQYVSVIAILTLLVIYVTMVYGPIAALLVELFPTRIRYTAMSLPYHIGNGWFGGLLPTLSFAIVAQTGNIFSGLWYPVGVAAATAVIGAIWLREPAHRDINTDNPT